MTMEEKTQKRPNTLFQLLTIVLLLVLGVGAIILLQNKDSSINPTRKSILGKGAPAPNFALPNLDGKMVSLTDLKGKIVFLNIWATWCPPCVEEMPSIEKLYQKLKGEDFEILAVSIDTNGPEAVLPFMKKHKLNFTALADSKETLKFKYQITGVPESFIIDKNGIILEKIIGPRDWANADVVQYFRNLIQAE